ncbi:glyoxalase [Sphaerisporangium krabiense]|uniref:VOC family protein n=1 Tax=Sphaerisporangium krabiense TaxID=763782 RepID=UPI0019523875|nr:VOC family protein [Sphaerisporangium krabiense]GII61092.1 glyoxalase [Sphaerisporangium krabiense]
MQLFVNLPVKDLERSKKFFGELGFTLFGMAEGMASVVISQETQVMLLSEPTFASYIDKDIADAARGTEAILVLGMENPAQVDALVDKALASGATPAGVEQEDGVRYQRGFADLDGHHWEALCLARPAS